MPPKSLGIPALICLLTLVFAVLPYVFLGTQANVVAHDTLDANFVWAAVLAREGQIFAHAQDVVSPILGGLERHYFGSPYQLYYWLFALFPPFGALVIGEALTRLIAFVGAYALLSGFVAPRARQHGDVLLTSLVAAYFALLPFWLPGGAAVAGVPLFFWAALKARAAPPGKGSALAILSCALVFVFYGSMVLSGIFALIFTSGLILYDLWQKRWGKACRLSLFNGLTTVAFLWQNSWLFTLMASPVPTTRSEIVSNAQPSSDILDIILESFLEGQYHADPGTGEAVFIAVVVAILLAPLTRFYQNSQPVSSYRILVYAVLALALTALLYGLFRWDSVQNLLSGTILQGFNFGRFHWLQPALWCVAFAAALYVLRSALPWRRFANSVVFILIAAQLIFVAKQLPVYSDASKRNLPFDIFFATDVFDQIRLNLDGTEDSVRVGMIGIHPAIAQYNGFDTLGGYLQLYPLETKHKFRRIIAPELVKSDGLRRYFDEWGSRAYLFAADLEHCKGACFADQVPDIIDVNFNFVAFQALGGTHIISARVIDNADALGLTHLGSFQKIPGANEHYWHLHLYAVLAR